MRINSLFTDETITILALLNCEHAAPTSAVAVHLGVTTNEARAKMNYLASAGIVKRHPYSCSNGIKWMLNK